MASELRIRNRELAVKNRRLAEQRDQLREALEEILHDTRSCDARQIARAALKATEEG